MDTRAKAEQQMGVSMPQSAWDLLEKFGAVEDVRLGRRDINWLTERAWDLLDNKGRSAAPSIVEPTRFDDPYQHTVSQLVALDAGREGSVKAFQTEVLGGRLLPAADVANWIDHHSELDGPGTTYVRFPLPEAVSVGMNSRHELVATPAIVVDEEHPTAGWELATEMLDYIKPDSAWVHCVPVASTGVLGRLRRVSEHLARVTGWWKASATDFILTGRIPLLPRVGASVTSEGRGVIRLTVDPMVTPRELAAAYQRLRRRVFQGRRLRTLSPKHLALALLVARRPDEPWSELRESWNAQVKRSDQYPKAAASRFRRDAIDAAKRLNDARISLSSALGWLSEPTDHARGPRVKAGVKAKRIR